MTMKILILLLSLTFSAMAFGDDCLSVNGRFLTEDGKISVELRQTKCESVSISEREVSNANPPLSIHNYKTDGAIHQELFTSRADLFYAAFFEEDSLNIEQYQLVVENGTPYYSNIEDLTYYFEGENLIRRGTLGSSVEVLKPAP